MNIEMIYLLVIVVIILLFGILYMRLLNKYRLLMHFFNLKKRRADVMEKTIEILKRENSALQGELEKVGKENENPKEHTEINPNH